MTKDMRTESFTFTWPEFTSRLDVIFSPGLPPGIVDDDLSRPNRNEGWICIECTAKGIEAVEAIFPGAGLNWKPTPMREVSTIAFAGWQGCCPNLPELAATVPNTLPEHLVKMGPLDTKSDAALCFLLAVAARQHGARAGWIEFQNGKMSSGILADTEKDARIANLDFERLKRNPRVVPLSRNYAAKQVRSALAGSKVHLFELTAPVIKEIQLMSEAERRAELEGMDEFNLLHLPFGDDETVAIRFNYRDVAEGFDAFRETSDAEKAEAGRRTVTVCVNGKVSVKGAKNTERAFAFPGEMNADVFVERPGEPLHVIETDAHADEQSVDRFAILAIEATTILLLALGDKNIVKNDRLNGAKPKSLRGLTSGPQGMIYVSRTRLEVPPDLPLEPGTHKSPVPHRRRSHVRGVRYGTGRAQVRRQWFPAVWVNGDRPENYKPKSYEVRS